MHFLVALFDFCYTSVALFDFCYTRFCVRPSRCVALLDWGDRGGGEVVGDAEHVEPAIGGRGGAGSRVFHGEGEEDAVELDAAVDGNLREPDALELSSYVRYRKWSSFVTSQPQGHIRAACSSPVSAIEKPVLTFQPRAWFLIVTWLPRVRIPFNPQRG